MLVTTPTSGPTRYEDAIFRAQKAFEASYSTYASRSKLPDTTSAMIVLMRENEMYCSAAGDGEGYLYQRTSKFSSVGGADSYQVTGNACLFQIREDSIWEPRPN